MRRLALILLGLFVGGTAAHTLIMLRPGTPDFAELTDDCSTPSFSTQQYQNLVKEAKLLVSGYGEVKKQVRDGSPRSLEREYLTKRFGEFISLSKSPEETFVRYHAFARALSGRRVTADTPSLGRICWDSRGAFFDRRHVLVAGSYQVPNGTFSWDTADDFLSWLLGRRNEEFAASLWFSPESDPPTTSSLKGVFLKDFAINKMAKVSPTTSVHWGDTRIQNTCPVYADFIARAETWTKSQEGECR